MRLKEKIGLRVSDTASVWRHPPHTTWPRHVGGEEPLAGSPPGFYKGSLSALGNSSSMDEYLHQLETIVEGIRQNKMKIFRLTSSGNHRSLQV
ncbi:hypothetical protein E2C01_000198 [Portunus trituberculatus]|uniref:Uncharacterized protein n=1 Tax=Portunus trituberculatus TaxID=210409 RepID=A0A5B7CFW0_PORTR|nr:hypothetical protein [Portunus trituberculatus]